MFCLVKAKEPTVLMRSHKGVPEEFTIVRSPNKKKAIARADTTCDIGKMFDKEMIQLRDLFSPCSFSHEKESLQTQRHL